jgi:hypothetical protein
LIKGIPFKLPPYKCFFNLEPHFSLKALTTFPPRFSCSSCFFFSDSGRLFHLFCKFVESFFSEELLVPFILYFKSFLSSSLLHCFFSFAALLNAAYCPAAVDVRTVIFLAVLAESFLFLNPPSPFLTFLNSATAPHLAAGTSPPCSFFLQPQVTEPPFL